MKFEIGQKGAIEGLSECPHCGSQSGYFRKTKISGITETNYSFDGSDADNSELHTPAKYVDQKTLYCQDCRKPIGVAK